MRKNTKYLREQAMVGPFYSYGHYSALDFSFL